jgi:glutamate synthase domain-containing protein 3
MIDVDVETVGVRALNERLHKLPSTTNERLWRILNPKGAHALAVGLQTEVEVEIDGHVGYYCGGMNKAATITVSGHAGPGLAENIMSGLVRVKGNASQAAAASGHGGLSMKGVDIVVGGSVGHMSAFMAQAGHLVVCGDAGAHLGDSIYEAVVYVRGRVESLGSDCVEKEMTAAHRAKLADLLARAGSVRADPTAFRRYGSARQLYNFKVDHAAQY